MKSNKIAMIACLAAICGTMLCACNDDSAAQDASSAAELTTLTTETTTDTTSETTDTTAETTDTDAAVSTEETTDTEAAAETTAETEAETTAAPETTAAAVTTAETTTQPPQTTKAATNGTNIFTELKVGEDCSKFLKAHTDYEMEEADSCLGNGKDRTYVYKGFTLFTYFDGVTSKLTEVDLTKPQYITAQGIKIGMSRAQVEKIVGKDKADSFVENDVMTEITYSADVVESIVIYSTLN